MMLTRSEIVLGGLIFTNLAALIIAGFEASRLKKVNKEFSDAVKKVVNDEVVISDEFIDRAVEKEIEKEARYQVGRSVDKAIERVAKSFESEIKNKVEDEFKLQQYDVKKEMQRQIGNIDIRDIKREVIAEAKQAATQKLKNDLEDISDKYTEQLDAMTNIYQTVASKIESIGD